MGRTPLRVSVCGGRTFARGEFDCLGSFKSGGHRKAERERAVATNTATPQPARLAHHTTQTKRENWSERTTGESGV